MGISPIAKNESSSIKPSGPTNRSRESPSTTLWWSRNARRMSYWQPLPLVPRGLAIRRWTSLIPFTREMPPFVSPASHSTRPSSVRVMSSPQLLHLQPREARGAGRGFLLTVIGDLECDELLSSLAGDSPCVLSTICQFLLQHFQRPRSGRGRKRSIERGQILFAEVQLQRGEILQ